MTTALTTTMGATTTGAAQATTPPEDTGPLGMWIFLATEVLFFGGLLFGYLYARTQWPQGFAAASRHTDVLLGTLNTGILLTSSALAALAVSTAEDRSAKVSRWTGPLLAATALLGALFLAVKGVEWHAEWREGLFPGPGFALAGTRGAELFFMLYFLITGLHAVHLTIGVTVMATFAVGRRRRRAWAAAPHVEIAALYWHFVDVVWIVLYPLIYLVSRHS